MRKGKVMRNNVVMRPTSRALAELRSAMNKVATAVKTSPRRDKLTDILNEISLRTNPISEKNRELIEYSRYNGQLVRTSRRLYTKQEMLDLFAYDRLKSLDINKVPKIGKFYDYHHNSENVFYRSVSKEEVLKMLSPSDAKVYKIACEKGVDWDTAVNMANDIANNKKTWWRFW